MHTSHFTDFFSHLKDSTLDPYLDTIQSNIDKFLDEKRHGRWKEWETEIENKVPHTTKFQDLSTMHLGRQQELSEQQHILFHEVLECLIPWRKGPFCFFDIEIETEWRSDWKWDRIKDHIDLKDKRILDVGCGSGYHCWKMWESGAKWVLGINPTQVYYFQYLLTKKLLGGLPPVYFLPIGIEYIPQNTQAFDVVFSMGILYHRKSPIEHLQTLRSQLQKGGTLVLETLVVEGPLHYVLVPKDRYAKMRNVWFLPSPPTLIHWLQRVGFIDVKLIDINQTSIEEQKMTRWMPYQSLSDFLNPTNPNLTIEGYPSPKRAFFTARRA